MVVFSEVMERLSEVICLRVCQWLLAVAGELLNGADIMILSVARMQIIIVAMILSAMILSAMISALLVADMMLRAL